MHFHIWFSYMASKLKEALQIKFCCCHYACLSSSHTTIHITTIVCIMAVFIQAQLIHSLVVQYVTASMWVALTEYWKYYISLTTTQAIVYFVLSTHHMTIGPSILVSSLFAKKRAPIFCTRYFNSIVILIFAQAYVMNIVLLKKKFLLHSDSYCYLPQITGCVMMLWVNL